MKQENIDRAKKIHFDYLGDKFQMMRDGLYDEYKTYNISDAQEKKWIESIFDDKLNSININDVNSFSSILLILRFNSEMLKQNLQKIINFLAHNENLITSKLDFLFFSQKIIEIIDYYIDNYKDTDKNLLKNEKHKLQRLREKYL